MHQSLVDSYKSQHQHPMNRLCHMIGVPMITISWPLFFFKWRWALALFVAGWVLQFVGHAIEGNRPAFLRNPLYFFVAPLWLAQRVARAVGLLHSSPSK
ncbi:MAG TPA: DUF962 domain-containing protein [Pyrinomonadaceae bacterium]